ncbi:MAG: HSP20 family protein [Parcubacteria group bacterium Gr01-1014_70]|nr:MAG: HSP20 family protein [Parcubacteria group bacterium Gr01-1014_70]
MDDEKFFEELSKGNLPVGDEPEVTLAKASRAPETTAARSVPVAPKTTKQAAKKDDEPEGQLAIDVYQTNGDVIVESAIAGVKPEDIDISVTSDSVTVRGERRKEEEVKEDSYYYQECYWGRFSRSVILPQEIEPEGATVSFKNGVLTIRLPKANKAKMRKLKVKAE